MWDQSARNVKHVPIQYRFENRNICLNWNVHVLLSHAYLSYNVQIDLDAVRVLTDGGVARHCDTYTVVLIVVVAAFSFHVCNKSLTDTRNSITYAHTRPPAYCIWAPSRVLYFRLLLMLSLLSVTWKNFPCFLPWENHVSSTAAFLIRISSRVLCTLVLSM